MINSPREDQAVDVAVVKNNHHNIWQSQKIIVYLLYENN